LKINFSTVAQGIEKESEEYRKLEGGGQERRRAGKDSEVEEDDEKMETGCGNMLHTKNRK
jgi:hypothetical protein